MNTKRNIIPVILMYVIIVGLIVGQSVAPVAASSTSGSGSVNAPISQDITMKGYSNWPSAITASGSGKFACSLLDGSGNLWLVPTNAGAVVKVNTSTGSMTSYSDWPASLNGSAQYKFRSAVYDGNGSLWLIPFAADQVVRLDTATGAMTAYNSWPAGFDATTSAKFTGAVYHNGSIYMIPSLASGIVKLDTATGAMALYDQFPNGFFGDSVKFSGGVKDNSGNLWLIPSNTNMLVKMNLSTGAMTGYSDFPGGIDSLDASKFSGGALDSSGNLWLIPSSAAAVVKVNTASGQMTAYSSFPSGVSATGLNKFAGGVWDGSSLWLVPHNTAALVRLNPSSGAMTGHTSYPQGFSSSGGAAFMGGVFDGSSLWLTPYDANQLVQVKSAASLSLQVDSSQPVYTPDAAVVNVTRGGGSASLNKVEYFRLKTSATTTVTADTFGTFFTSASESNKGLATISQGQASFPADQNGIYWVKAVFADGSSVVSNLKIDHIYTPCLYVKGATTSGSVLYLEEAQVSHGLPLDLDGSLLENPAHGYQEVEVTAKDLNGYTPAGQQTKRISLNNILYQSAANNTIGFTYTRANPDETIDPETPVDPDPDEEDVPGGSGSGSGDGDDGSDSDGGDSGNSEGETPDGSTDPQEPTIPTETDFDQGFLDWLEDQEPAPAVDGQEDIPPLEFIHEDSGSKMVTYTLTRVAYPETATANSFYIIDQPSVGLSLISGSIPAFTKGAGLTYDLLYKTEDTASYQVLATGLPADAPHQFLNDTGEAFTEITLYFEHVPAGFAANNQIRYTFRVEDDNYTNAYRTLWSIIGSAEVTDSSAQLMARIEELEILTQQYADSPLGDYLNSMLEYAAALLEDPYTSEQQLAYALELVDAALALAQETEALQAATPNGTPLLSRRYLLPGCMGLISLAIFVASRRKLKRMQAAA